jgi:hypothetical protein
MLYLTSVLLQVSHEVEFYGISDEFGQPWRHSKMTVTHPNGYRYPTMVPRPPQA